MMAEMVEGLCQVMEIIPPLLVKYLHQKTCRTTLISRKVEMSEIFCNCMDKDNKKRLQSVEEKQH
jgi:hypothetical protein